VQSAYKRSECSDRDSAGAVRVRRNLVEWVQKNFYFRGSRVIEDEMVRILYCDLKCKFQGPLLWSSVKVPGYRSKGPGFDSRRYQIFWEVVGLELGLLNLVRITEELLKWKNSSSGSRKSWLTVVGICYANHAAPSIPKIWALTSPTCGGR
jgi:hypothetical protein